MTVDLGDFVQYADLTWRELWFDAWPNVPTSEASEADVALFKAHADSLNRYIKSGGSI